VSSSTFSSTFSSSASSSTSSSTSIPSASLEMISTVSAVEPVESRDLRNGSSSNMEAAVLGGRANSDGKPIGDNVVA